MKRKAPLLGLFCLYLFTHIFIFNIFDYKNKNMNILIKEIDQLMSKNHKDRVVSEYIIYLQENGVNVACITVFGEDNKNTKLQEVIVNLTETGYSSTVIKEISFEETMKNLN